MPVTGAGGSGAGCRLRRVTREAINLSTVERIEGAGKRVGFIAADWMGGDWFGSRVVSASTIVAGGSSGAVSKARSNRDAMAACRAWMCSVNGNKPKPPRAGLPVSRQVAIPPPTALATDVWSAFVSAGRPSNSAWYRKELRA